MESASADGGRRRLIRRLIVAAAAAAALDPSTGRAQTSATSEPIEALGDLSIDQLARIDISSVSKTSQPLNEAPAAVYVITHDDIVRSGATSIPEMLRLAPNLQVAQTGADSWVITARGFSGSSSAQSYSNKLLVLIDGRSVYTPLYSGVYWDAQDVLPDDVERIEVISGPGATLWGANAVNGVINIITKKSADTQGALLDVSGGNLDRGASFRYGGRVGDNLTWRVYARGYEVTDSRTATGADAENGWSKPQGGFRLDWTPGDEIFTLQGDIYRGDEEQPGAPDQFINGQNVLGRWTHPFGGGSNLQVQAYYDETQRGTASGGAFTLDTYDVDVQDSFSLGSRNSAVVGGGYRVSDYDITNAASLLFSPDHRVLDLANGFIQDTLSLTKSLKLTAGLKLENDPYSGLSVLPSARLSWKVTDQAMVWTSVSRAVRSPTPFDEDVIEYLGGVKFLTGDSEFKTEKLTAYEAGVRVQPTPRASFSVSVYYNVYDDLRSLEFAPTGLILPLQWGNLMQGDTYGIEAWGDYRLTDWWRLSAGVNAIEEQLRFKPGSSGLLGIAQAGDDPPQQAMLRSSMNLGPKVTLDADLRYVAALPDPAVPAYTELGGRVAWLATKHLELGLTGANLLHAHHLEFPAPGADPVQRQIALDARLKF